MKKVKIIVLGLLAGILTAQAQNLLKSMDFGGSTRKYRIYIPSIYDGSQPVPLVMALHGLGDNINNFQGVGFNQIANTGNFIAVYPEALPEPTISQFVGMPTNGWNAGINPLNNMDDVGFLNAMLDTVKSTYSIDTNRIYTCGFSLGGFMSYRLACESGQRFAAIASVAGTLPQPLVPTCDPHHPLPVLHIHGTSDSTIPYIPGVIFFVVNNLGADSTVHFWVKYNGCQPPPSHDLLPDTTDDGFIFEKNAYNACSDESEVLFYKANGMDHEWPYSPDYDIDATTEIWNFFSRHTKTDVNTTVSAPVRDFFISPNPASAEVSVQLNFPGKMKFVLNDLAGKEMLRGEIIGSPFTFSVANLNPAIYLLTLTNNALTLTKKLIVSK